MRYLKKTFYCVFVVLFIWVITLTMFFNKYHDTAYILPITFICIMGLLLIYRAIDSYMDITDKGYNRLLIVYSAVMFLIQIIVGSNLKFDPVYDMGAVYKGATEWAETGTFANYYDYFEWFPNNFGTMNILHIVFKVFSIVGIKNYFMEAVIFNSALSVCMMVVVSKICTKKLGIKHGVFALSLFAVTTPFYTIGAAFYTDALSMLFPVLFYYLYIKSEETTGKKDRIITYVLMGLTASIGMQIKFTVLIAVIAVGIDICLKLDYKRFISVGSIVSVMVIISQLFTNSILYNGHIDKEAAKVKNTPYLHWVMMGMKGDGFYNPSDYDFTRSFNDVKERRKGLLDEIKSRAEEMGYKGLYRLYSVKAAVDFGDGTYGLSDQFSNGPEKKSSICRYVLYDGDDYGKYTHFCTSLHIAVMILMLFGAIEQCLGKKKDNLVPFMSVFGIFIFLMMWETNRRYFTNFVPMILLCAVFGISYFDMCMKKLKNKLSE